MQNDPIDEVFGLLTAEELSSLTGCKCDSPGSGSGLRLHLRLRELYGNGGRATSPRRDAGSEDALNRNAERMRGNRRLVS